MIAALDVHYRADGAKAVALLFDNWEAEHPLGTVNTLVNDVAPYEPGAFYKRELPCLLAVLDFVDRWALSAIIIDGYVTLPGGRPGLGLYLYDALKLGVPVVGVAKTPFHQVTEVALPLLRGGSGNPLWITAVGLEVVVAADCIARMHGKYRMPTLLSQLDQETRLL